MATVPSEEMIRNRWNTFSKKYSMLFSREFRPYGLMMANMLGCDKADFIVEMGCGDGTITSDIARLKKAGAKLVANDLAPNMVKITGERLKKVLANKSQEEVLSWVDPDTVTLEGDCIDLPELNSQVFLKSNEDLKQQVPDSSADAVLASLSLHIVEKPENMLAETFRMLKKGGQAMFSVWGQMKNSNQFLLVGEIRKKYGIEMPPTRMPWHMNDIEKVKTLATQAGFEIEFLFENFVPLAENSEEGYRRAAEVILGNDWPENLADKYEEAIAYYNSRREEIQKTENLPLGLNTLFIKVKKP